ncbi:Ail/Lom family outer membrane beta-barrel protein [Arsenophonus sp. PmNCSU2021_1]|uniref:Ail/Lom family outer membrane beta-barrel protein n=1 Tax=Arsenophonus sp. PmNCSU2021_1 TaxID=3118989 RepID=UPI002FF16AF7
MKKTLLFLIPTLFSGAVMAKAGESTLSFGYLNVKSNEVKDQVNLLRENASKAGDEMNHHFGKSATLSLDSYHNLGGAFMRYRYEIDDESGIISSIAYSTKDYNATAKANKNDNKDRIHARGKVSGDYVSLMVGPTYRVNDYVSLYGLIGGAYKKASYESNSQEFRDNKLVNSAKYSNSDNKTQLAYGVGMQVNFWQGATLDVGYERSGSGEWKTDAFTVWRRV